MSALVTIGLPCWNSERWIEGAVKSALAQSWPDKEVIVVDDGSTDRSREILRGFGDAIRVLETSHEGANHARNQILKHARGEWVQYLDADDYLLPTKIADQLATPRDADVLYSPVWVEEERTGAREISTVDPAEDLFTQWLSWTLPQTGACLWKKTALAALGGWNETMPCCQEHELYLRALQGDLRFVFTPEIGAVYRIWSESTLCRRDPLLVLRTKTALIDRMHDWLREHGAWTEKHQTTAGRACFEMARTFAKYDLPGAARYAEERRAHGLFALAGPAAPRSYRLMHDTFGFTLAERFATLARSFSA